MKTRAKTPAIVSLIAYITLTGSACTPRHQSKTLSGVIQIEAKNPPHLGNAAVLYVMLRDATPGAKATAPIAVRKYLPPFQFPMEYSIGHHDALDPATALPDQLLLSARIAIRGSATPILPEDWTSGAPIAVQLGATDTQPLILSRKPESSSRLVDPHTVERSR